MPKCSPLGMGGNFVTLFMPTANATVNMMYMTVFILWSGKPLSEAVYKQTPLGARVSSSIFDDLSMYNWIRLSLIHVGPFHCRFFKYEHVFTLNSLGNCADTVPNLVPDTEHMPTINWTQLTWNKLTLTHCRKNDLVTREDYI